MPRLEAAIVAAALCAAAAPSLAASDVAVVPVGKELRITGGVDAASIQVLPGGTTGALTVTGVDGTTVNGAASATFQRVRSVLVLLGTGDDRVDVADVFLPGNLRIGVSGGADRVRLLGVAVGGRCVVRCGDGVDDVSTDTRCVFHRSFLVRGEAGNDGIVIGGGEFRDRLRLQAGPDDDRLLVQGATCTDLSRFETFGGRGHDLVELVSSTFLDDVRVAAAFGDDRVRIASCRFERDLSLDGGVGRLDAVTFEPGSTFARLLDLSGFEFEVGVPIDLLR
jgi:hypothetical protein